MSLPEFRTTRITEKLKRLVPGITELWILEKRDEQGGYVMGSFYFYNNEREISKDAILEDLATTSEILDEVYGYQDEFDTHVRECLEPDLDKDHDHNKQSA